MVMNKDKKGNPYTLLIVLLVVVVALVVFAVNHGNTLNEERKIIKHTTTEICKDGILYEEFKQSYDYMIRVPKWVRVGDHAEVAICN